MIIEPGERGGHLRVPPEARASLPHARHDSGVSIDLTGHDEAGAVTSGPTSD